MITNGILQCLITACGLNPSSYSSKTLSSVLSVTETSYLAAADALENQQVDYIQVTPEGQINSGKFSDKKPKFRLIVAGSFNPLHKGIVTYNYINCNCFDKGHQSLLSESRKITTELSEPYYDSFELSAFNVDKPTLSVQSILERISQFSGYESSK